MLAEAFHGGTRVCAEERRLGLYEKPDRKMNNTTGGTSETPRHLKLDSFLPYRLIVLAEQVTHSFARIYGRRFGISNPEWRVMAVLGEANVLTSTDIVHRGRMHKTKVSRAVSDLEGKGFLTRRTSQTDMRVAHLSLTPRGRALYEQIVPLAESFSDRLTSELDQEEQAILHRAVEVLTSRAGTVAEEFEPGS